jgi:galactokinase
MILRNNIIAAFSATYGYKPTILARAPGRVNLLGAHVDYNDGWVLPAAIDRAIWLAAAPTGGERVRIKSLDMDQSHETSISDLAQGQKQIESQDPHSQWRMIPSAWPGRSNKRIIRWQVSMPFSPETIQSAPV